MECPYFEHHAKANCKCDGLPENTIGRWRDAKTEPPPEKTEIFVRMKKGFVTIATYKKSHDGLMKCFEWQDQNRMPIYSPTHWMSLPARSE